MKRPELDSILKKARLPEPSEGFWEEFPEQVARQLNRPLAETRQARGNWLARLAWGAATAACVVMAFVTGHWRGRLETQAASSPDILANAALVRETLAMFPNQLRAIVEDKQGLHLILSDKGVVVPSSPPLYIRVCDGKNCSSLVTFSGQDIEVGGQKMTVLADTEGGVILMGNDFVWASDQKTDLESHLKIEAKSLGSAAL
jgi:hypothetical protein